MIVQDILRPDAPVASPEETATAAWERMHALDADYLVVVQRGEVVGVLSRHDLGGPSGGTHRRMGRTVADLMRADPVVASPTSSVRHVASLMRRHGVGCVPIVQQGRLLGIVTVTQLLELLEKQLAGT